ncbi:CHAT domain-containing protein [Flexithrix dorotheae]|uniref:CHAT domain-containing protein n=1 Tax=Flexithrix dorotheae TaxID=70993 RepID=UPI00039F5E06|nr:CHAT domain-containing protein [Flexithrix dorotheae]
MNHYPAERVFCTMLYCMWLVLGFGFYGKAKSLSLDNPYPEITVVNSKATTLISDSIKQMLVPENYEYLDQGDDLVAKNKIAEAIDAYTSASEKFKSENNEDGYFIALIKTGYCQRRLRQYKKSFSILNFVLDSASKRFDHSSLILAEAHHFLGQCFDYTNDSENALIHYNQGLNTRIKKLGKDHILVADSYQSLGDLSYYVLHDNKKADLYFKSAQNIYENQSPKDELKIAKNYNMLSMVNRKKGDFENALTYSKKAIEIFNNFNDNISLYKAYNGLANIYFEKKAYQKASEFYEIAIDLEGKINKQEPSELRVKALTNVGTCYLNLSEYNDALKYYFIALRVLNRLQEPNYILKSALFSNIGMSYGHTKPDSGKFYLNKALEIRRDIYNESHQKVADIYNWFGDLYLENDDPDSALVYYQKALFSPIENLHASDLLSNPEASWLNTDLTTIVLLKQKTRALMKKADLSAKTEKEAILRAALNTCLLAKKLIYTNQVSYFHEGSKLLLLDENANLYEYALDCGYQLFLLTRDDQYIHLCFEFLEARKATILSESFQYAEILNSSGIPDSVMEKRRQLIFEQEKNNKIITGTENQEEKKNAQSRLFEISRELEKLVESLENNYPQYQQLGQANKTEISELQQHLGGSASGLINYLYGEEAIYCIGMNKEEMIMHKIDISPNFQENIHTYIACLKHSNSNVSKVERQKQLLNSAWYLYNVLIEPFQPVLNSKTVERIVLVPDGLLSFIPFESFITRPVDSIMNFRNAPYFLYDYNTSYHFSAGLFNTMPHKNRDKGLGEVLAFSFSRELDKDKLAGNFSIFRDDEFRELPGTAIELETISKYVGGAFFSGKDATKEIFMEKAPNYKMLHLAIHGEADAENKYNTRLIFNSPEDDMANKNLYSHELYNLNLKSELVVLSACESGLGKQYTGEGVFSMARGFVYAGVPSVVNTLWKINDNFSADIMGGFYQELADGKQVDEALQQAKINYIHQADEISADPANWAAFILLGEKEALTTRGFFKNSWLIFCIVIATGLIFFFFYIKRKAKASA